MYEIIKNNYKSALSITAFCVVLFLFRYIFSVATIFFIPQYNLYNPKAVEKITASNFVKAYTPYTDISYLWSKWDTVYYLQIAQHGYDHGRFDKKQIRNWAFYPLYSYLVRVASLPFLQNTLAVLWTGVILSNIAFLAAIFYLRKLFSLLGIENTDSWGIIALLIAFPTSYFFSLFYPESVFLLLSVLYFYFLFQRKYVSASLFVGLAFVTKAQASSLFLPFYLYYCFKEILPLFTHKGVIASEAKQSSPFGTFDTSATFGTFLKLPLYLAIQLLPVVTFYYHLYDVTGDFFAAWKIQTLWNADLYPFSLFVSYYKYYGLSVDMSHIFTIIFMLSLMVAFVIAAHHFLKSAYNTWKQQKQSPQQGNNLPADATPARNAVSTANWHQALQAGETIEQPIIDPRGTRDTRGTLDSRFPEYLSLFAYAFSFIIVLSSISSFNSVFRYAGVNFVFFLLPVVFLGIKPKHILLFGSIMIMSLLLQSFFFILFLITIPAYGF